MASLMKKVDFRFSTLENELVRLKCDAENSKDEDPDAITHLDSMIEKARQIRVESSEAFTKLWHERNEKKRKLHLEGKLVK